MQTQTDTDDKRVSPENPYKSASLALLLSLTHVLRHVFVPVCVSGSETAFSWSLWREKERRCVTSLELGAEGG